MFSSSTNTNVILNTIAGMPDHAADLEITVDIAGITGVTYCTCCLSCLAYRCTVLNFVFFLETL